MIGPHLFKHMPSVEKENYVNSNWIYTDLLSGTE